MRAHQPAGGSGSWARAGELTRSELLPSQHPRHTGPLLRFLLPDKVSSASILAPCAAKSAMMSTSLTMTFPAAAELISRSTPLAADPTYASWACRLPVARVGGGQRGRPVTAGMVFGVGGEGHGDRCRRLQRGLCGGKDRATPRTCDVLATHPSHPRTPLCRANGTCCAHENSTPSCEEP